MWNQSSRRVSNTCSACEEIVEFFRSRKCFRNKTFQCATNERSAVVKGESWCLNGALQGRPLRLWAVARAAEEVKTFDFTSFTEEQMSLWHKRRKKKPTAHTVRFFQTDLQTHRHLPSARSCLKCHGVAQSPSCSPPLSLPPAGDPRNHTVLYFQFLTFFKEMNDADF